MERLDFRKWREYDSAPREAAIRAARAHPSWGKVYPGCRCCGGAGFVRANYKYVPRSRFELCDLSEKYADFRPDDGTPAVGPPEDLLCKFCEQTGPMGGTGDARCGWCKGTGRIANTWDPESWCLPASDVLMLFPEGFATDKMATPDGRLLYYDLDHYGESLRQQCREEMKELLLRHPDGLAVFAYVLVG